MICPLAMMFDIKLFHAALISAGFGALGMALLLIGHKLFHAIDLGKKLTRVNFKEQIQNGNIAAALYEGMVEAAFLLGLAYIVGRVVSA
jgi:uncharacterized membrane protein YjfL (UPF0719 family)